MTHRNLFTTTLAAAVLALSATSLWAQTTVKVDDAWVRGTVAQQKATGAFMRLTPEKNARLVAASSPVAGVVEIHKMVMENDVMKMRQIPGLDLAAGRTLDLKPGGYHVMLMDLKAPLAKGATVPLTLVFKDAQGAESQMQLQVPVSVQAPGAAGAHGMGMKH